LVNSLLATIAELKGQIEKQSAGISELKERVKSLEDQQSKNSRNSSKPPSTDNFIKPKSLRRRSGRSPGGQKGHPGHTLKMVENPEHIVPHQVFACKGCGFPLKETEATGYEKRQMFDLPPIRVETTEHRTEKKRCPYCGYLNKATFPEEVQHPVQYGPHLKAIAVYLSQYQLLPYERTSELFSDLFNHQLSQATLVNANKRCYKILEPVEEKIKEEIIASPVVHFDETGLHINAKREWLHVASTKTLTFYGAHAKRGGEATNEIGILPKFQGTAVHDFWKPYFKYLCQHALCNAHHLRDLTGILEQDKQDWPQDMIDLLCEIKKTVEEKKPVANQLDPAQIKNFEIRYDKIIEKGLTENPLPKLQNQAKKKRGKKKQSKAKNFLDRLKEYRRQTLAFMYDFNTPFDNNQGERDIRMMKVQQKISGTFRSTQGAKTFCCIGGYISTVRKNSVSVINAIEAALKGNPFIPVGRSP